MYHICDRPTVRNFQASKRCQTAGSVSDIRLARMDVRATCLAIRAFLALCLFVWGFSTLTVAFPNFGCIGKLQPCYRYYRANGLCKDGKVTDWVRLASLVLAELTTSAKTHLMSFGDLVG